ncbi:hypothetical protein H6P81_019355 [Aristolochia fimbriata]|uniref:Uncharacterized protein n=1 Tax=Aristolochia fimbriata TaxID=158543 RepID=A0AAV7DRH6_ARIFI|nr:hypothetical protein H6P81_019355 [Aristolochia fimbriata]
MDFSSQGISWVGNMYQKLETVCVDMLQEMDHFMAQEPASSVETQLQTVGVNVQKFYNEVMKDILSPSPIHSIQVPVTDLSVACDIGVGFNQPVLDKNPVLPAELDLVSTKVMTVSPVEDSSPGLRKDVTQNELCKDEYDMLCNKSESSCLEEENCRNVSDEATLIDKCSGSLLTDSDFDGLPAALSSSLSSSVTGTDTMFAAISVGSSPVLETSEPGEGGTADMENASDVIDVTSEVQEKFEDLFLGESYLDVQSNEIDNDHSILSHRVAIRKSYKKKLRGSLLSKFLLATKHNYRKVQILSSGVGDRCPGSSSPFSTSDELMDLKKSPSQEFSESEWELL